MSAWRYIREAATVVGYASVMELSVGQRKAVTAKLAGTYRRGSRADKERILDELVELTGWHRDHARRAIRSIGTVRLVQPRAPRPPTYPEELVAHLTLCWRIARYPTGKRLAPMLPVLLDALRRDGELQMTDAEARQLLAMSPATIDRRLGAARRLLMPTGRSHTKPGTLLKSQIPIRTWSEWDDARPGFVEIDLVGHEGGNPLGEFCFTLTMTDITTGWTVNRSVPNKAAVHVTEAIDHARRQFPFPLLGIDSDIQDEFVFRSPLSSAGEARSEVTGARSSPMSSDRSVSRLLAYWSRGEREHHRAGNVLLRTR